MSVPAQEAGRPVRRQQRAEHHSDDHCRQHERHRDDGPRHRPPTESQPIQHEGHRQGDHHGEHRACCGNSQGERQHPDRAGPGQDLGHSRQVQPTALGDKTAGQHSSQRQQEEHADEGQGNARHHRDGYLRPHPGQAHTLSRWRCRPTGSPIPGGWFRCRRRGCRTGRRPPWRSAPSLRGARPPRRRGRRTSTRATPAARNHPA